MSDPVTERRKSWTPLLRERLLDYQRQWAEMRAGLPPSATPTPDTRVTQKTDWEEKKDPAAR